LVSCLNGVSANAFELWTYLLDKLEVLLRVVEVLLEVVVAELVSILVFAVFIRVYLDCVISQVDELVLSVIQLEFVATRTDISLIVPVTLNLAILDKK
jgi:hypothetical protein